MDKGQTIQWSKEKRATNNLQNTRQKTKDWPTQTPPKKTQNKPG
jgi:hypothetical protein